MDSDQKNGKKVSPQKKMSPGRRQYLEIKSSYKNELLLYRMGDFYETFDEDAHVLASVLGIALTERDVGAKKKSSLAGIPAHSIDNHIKTLIDADLTVVIAEQTSDPTESKGIVERAVVRIITPGTVLETSILDVGANSYLVSVCIENNSVGLAYLDITTSEFNTQTIKIDQLKAELERLQPREIIVHENDRLFLENILVAPKLLRFVEGSVIDFQDAIGILSGINISINDIREQSLAVKAAAMAYHHASGTQMGHLPQITALKFLFNDDFMLIDGRALRDLEIFTSNGDGKSLFECMNETETPMGTRLLRNWISKPLKNINKIKYRLDAVDLYVSNVDVHSSTVNLLKNISDVERILNRTRTFSCNPRDLISLKESLRQITNVSVVSHEILNTLSIPQGFPDNSKLINLLESTLFETPSNIPGDGSVIKNGYSKDLDELRDLLSDTSNAILALENNVKEKTGIKTLKIGFNRVFGYYIEVTRSHLLNVPDSFERRQSLVNSERFVTAELKELETKILSARDRVSVIEKNLFKSICTEVNSYSDSILHSANLIANIDVICSYANVAMGSGWIKPKVNTSFDIKIKAGRHPTVESNLGSTQFVPNDVDISHIGKRINVITGPNMSGKSTYIRQIGILCMLAQSGSFIPAESATIGLVDRIFTRAGLGDDISEGKSTFMIEMIETAEILNNATDSSLAIMDEVGRGTSTYDGLAIARAVVEYIHNSKRPGFRTLFATHFHEMADLSNHLPDVYNLKVAVSEDSDGITFLRTILPGGSDKSYGVHVAKLAGMPDEVINRSWDLLRDLENDINPTVHPLQMEMDLDNETYLKSKELADYLLASDLDLMTPIEALNVLNTLKSKLDSGDLNES